MTAFGCERALAIAMQQSPASPRLWPSSGCWFPPRICLNLDYTPESSLVSCRAPRVEPASMVTDLPLSTIQSVVGARALLAGVLPAAADFPERSITLVYAVLKPAGTPAN